MAKRLTLLAALIALPFLTGCGVPVTFGVTYETEDGHTLGGSYSTKRGIGLTVDASSK